MCSKKCILILNPWKLKSLAGVNVVGGEIIGKDYYDATVMLDMNFMVFVEEKDCHAYDYTDSSDGTVSKRIWCDKVKIVPIVPPVVERKEAEIIIANPQISEEELQIEMYQRLGKFHNVMDMLNYYFPLEHGVKCIGAIEDNEKNQTDGHLRLAKFVTGELLNNIQNMIDISSTVAVQTISGNLFETKANNVYFAPLNAPRAEEIVTESKGLYFYLDGAVLIAINLCPRNEKEK